MNAHEFICKRCKKPLEVDPSFIDGLKNLRDLDNPLAYLLEEDPKKHFFSSESDVSVAESGFEVIQNHVVHDAASPTQTQPAPSTEPVSRRNHIPPRRNIRSNMSNSAVISKIFDVFQQASDDTEIDHPLCAECTEKILEELDAQLKETESENDTYREYLEQLSAADDGTDEGGSTKELEDDIATLEAEEKALRDQLLFVEEERKKLKREKSDLERDSEKLQNIEKLYWQNFNDFQTKLAAFQEERDAVRMSIEKANNQLEILKKTNLYNDAFHIWHDGHFGTINGFRLGDLPSRNVPWDEINAAWGQATLLLYIMAKKLNITFKHYRLVPMGSNSKIVKNDDGSHYELYGSNDYAITKLLWYGRYDKAMLAFLQCLKELGEHAENEDKHFRLPYRMDRDKIGEMSIKHNQYSMETWTKALKYMLTNLKWLLAWTARRQ